MSIPLFRAIFVNHLHSRPPFYHSAIQASIGLYTIAHLLGNRMNVGDSAVYFSSILRLVLYPPSLSIHKFAGPQWSERTDGRTQCTWLLAYILIHPLMNDVRFWGDKLECSFAIYWFHWAGSIPAFLFASAYYPAYAHVR